MLYDYVRTRCPVVISKLIKSNMFSKTHLEKAIMIMAFASFVFLGCFRLTYSPLWFDETIEYWHSKIMIGPLPYEQSNNMYERILNTYQPPLYNFIMFFWLKISSTEWWFRFFGVVMGFAANAGIYKTVNKFSHSYLASASVFLSSCIYQLAYYWQECAEYCLLLCLICWTIYYFVCLIETQNTKNIIVFTVFSVLSLYSQYGAVFPVGVMTIIAYFVVLKRKVKKQIITITITYMVTLITGIIPLLSLFMIKQINNQHNGITTLTGLTIKENIFTDFIFSLKETVSWGLFPYENGFEPYICIFLFFSVAVLIILLSKETYAKLLAITNVLTFVLYYITVKLGLYSYGIFGLRYSLFFIPLWIISSFSFGYEIYKDLKMKLSRKLYFLRYMYIGLTITLIVYFIITGLVLRVIKPYDKENMRDAITTWLTINGYESQTLVYYGGSSGFAYYLRQQSNDLSVYEKNVSYMPWMDNVPDSVIADYVYSIYGEKWPDEVYIIASHEEEDINDLFKVFIDRGYTMETLFSSGATLVKLSANL